ncbi:hypothetical protein BX616_001194 [Lobosporangium transversale]|uniref:Saposin B-type domain-containing protein n=1 Tax=Lobosporangium transversale TaxID=64571 RepID=A0A1Y2GTJ5_9FUNG|nr:hypothetical protein BCR41DRAFT_351174 [Lobosporangium transversale]KAF9917380.1 hypothetical protein BX616_001194 [Lobosporangium transversale]ORZ20050.1 hypothetical protein BCR41DRAFT_351174 [Lobosporangium transversale]|eukprot:XP_021882590.1 hypothetical protein BCR41DRAFT_351174 [Lobosporangium transversale]
MARLSTLLLAIVLTFIGISYVQACESACRTDPVEFLAKKYEDMLQNQVKKVKDSKASAKAKALIPTVMSQLKGRGKVIDKTIFSVFRGTCVPAGVGKRPPSELCGSAKSIACYAPWGHKQGVFDSVNKAVMKTIQDVYKNQNAAIKSAMIDDTAKFCPKNCKDWVKPFQAIMLGWEQREHPKEYKVTPNCLPLGKGGI